MRPALGASLFQPSLPTPEQAALKAQAPRFRTDLGAMEHFPSFAEDVSGGALEVHASEGQSSNDDEEEIGAFLADVD